MYALEDELGDIIAKARVGLGLTIDQLAVASGSTPADIQSIEAYRLKPPAADLVRLAGALNLDPAKLAEIAAEAWTPAPIDLSRLSAIVESIAVPYGGYGENCYIVACPETKLAAIVDPGGAVDEIARRLQDRGLTPDLVLVTHAHPDHTGGLRDMVAGWPDLRLANHQLERDSAVRGLSVKWEPAKDSIGIPLGSLKATPLATPGHTPGSVCYHIDGLCFVGDTLFAGSIGRPNVREAYKQMLADIRAKVLSLSEQTILLPGHGPATTVAEEKAHNPFF